jgi:hypothetical protein
MVRSLNGRMNVARVPEQFRVDCSFDCSIAQNGEMSNCPPFKGALLTIAHLRHSLLNALANNPRETERRRRAC